MLLFWNKFRHFQYKKVLFFTLQTNANYWILKFEHTPFKYMYCHFITQAVLL